MDGRLKRSEDISGQNKSALAQLIGHTKNVEKAVTSGQQDILNKKDQQSQKWETRKSVEAISILWRTVQKS